MLFLCEFEIFKGEQMYVARPFGLLGATQGYDLRDACVMAHEWLQMEGEYRLMMGDDIPELPLGNEPKHGGRILLVGAEVSLEGIDTVKASEAAEMLGVSRSRVSQMLKTSLLLGYRDGRDTYVTRDSINARLAERPKAGRPKKKTADQMESTPVQGEAILCSRKRAR